MDITVQSFSHAYATNLQQKQKGLSKKYNLLATMPQMNHNSLAFLNKNYSQLQISPKKISFGDAFTNGPSPVSNPPAIIPPKVELQDRINSAVAMMGKDDIVVVGKDLETAKKLLIGQVGLFDSPVKAIQLISDSSVDGAFMINKSDAEILSLTNMGSKSLTIQDGTAKNHVPIGKPIFVSEKSDYNIGNKKFKFDLSDSAAQIPLDDLDIENFDFSSKDENKIISINKNRILSMGVDENEVKGDKLTFSDVGGQDAAIKELKKAIVYPLTYPEAFANMKIDRGVVLTGGPGTGKSLMAEAIANECDAHFIKLNGLEMESKWVGQTEENWRNLFQEAKDNQPSIIFIDEFDAVAKNRTGSDTGRHDDKTVNQLLTLMSDLEKSKDDVFIIVATNKLDLIDPAIVRSGRFGKHIQVNNPDEAGCKKILDIHTKKLPLEASFDKDKFAKEMHTVDVSGADIAKIATESNCTMFDRLGIYEKMENKTFTMKDLEGKKITADDMQNSLEAFKKQKEVEKKEHLKGPIGFQAPSKQSSEDVS